MKVKKLKELIKELTDDMEVILQKDSEGNGYSPLSGGDDNCIYIPDTTWGGQVYGLNSTADDNCMEKDDWKEIKKRPKCLVLYPIN